MATEHAMRTRKRFLNIIAKQEQINEVGTLGVLKAAKMTCIYGHNTASTWPANLPIISTTIS